MRTTTAHTPIALAAYVAAVIAVGCGVLLGGWIGLSHATQTPPLSALAFWFVFAPASETFWLPTTSGKGMVSMSLAVSGAISLQTRMPFWTTWRRNYGFGFHCLNCAVLFALGLGLVLAIEGVGYISGLVSLLFLLISRDVHRYYASRTTKVSLPD